jgi:2-methylcitrate dehydratase PrpD
LATKGLGTYFEILENHTKIFACVSGFSASIECLITIMKEHGIIPDQIEGVDVGVRELTYMWSRPPEEAPKNILSAQMSIPYCMAVAAYEKDVKLSQFSDERLKDPKIIAFMRKVNVSPVEELSELNRQDTVCLPGRVTVKTKDGREFAHQLNYAKDSRGNRATRDELQEKFLDLCTPHISRTQCQEIIATVYELEKLDDVGKLARLCQAAH